MSDSRSMTKPNCSSTDGLIEAFTTKKKAINLLSIHSKSHVHCTKKQKYLYKTKTSMHEDLSNPPDVLNRIEN